MKSVLPRTAIPQASHRSPTSTYHRIPPRFPTSRRNFRLRSATHLRRHTSRLRCGRTSSPTRSPKALAREDGTTAKVAWWDRSKWPNGCASQGRCYTFYEGAATPSAPKAPLARSAVAGSASPLPPPLYKRHHRQELLAPSVQPKHQIAPPEGLCRN